MVKKKFQSKKTFTEKVRKNPWIISTLVLGLLVLVLIINGCVLTGKVVSKNQASEIIVDFVKSQTGVEVDVLKIDKVSGLYEVMVSYQGQEIPLYLTGDGENLVQGVTSLESLKPQEQVVPEVTKSDKPKVELFVMTHCPYGTQAEKGFIPAILALGDKIDASVKFVHYFLHDPEETETPIQVCIREEQGDKFNSYLKEFLVDGDSASARTKVGIDENKLSDCIANNADDYYALDSELSQGYGVQGSPSLVVNGQMVQSGRSSAAYLATICAAFNDVPEECSLQLDDQNPSPGFGYGTTSSIASAQC